MNHIEIEHYTNFTQGALTKSLVLKLNIKKISVAGEYTCIQTTEGTMYSNESYESLKERLCQN